MVSDAEVLRERYDLVADRIREIRGEQFEEEELGNYFTL